MGEVSEVGLTAKLVVLKLLSYCVWANKSRMRLWNRSNILDPRIGCALSVGGSVGHRRQLKTTDQFISYFYENLVQGESACESLHRAMNWMRNNGFSKWRQWAPFVLIGDDVSFDFEKPRSSIFLNPDLNRIITSLVVLCLHCFRQ